MSGLLISEVQTLTDEQEQVSLVDCTSIEEASETETSKTDEQEQVSSVDCTSTEESSETESSEVESSEHSNNLDTDTLSQIATFLLFEAIDTIQRAEKGEEKPWKRLRKLAVPTPNFKEWCSHIIKETSFNDQQILDTLQLLYQMIMLTLPCPLPQAGREYDLLLTAMMVVSDEFDCDDWWSRISGIDGETFAGLRRDLAYYMGPEFILKPDALWESKVSRMMSYCEATSQMSAKQELTFGLELEFIMLSASPGFQDPEPQRRGEMLELVHETDGRELFMVVYSILNKAGISTKNIQYSWEDPIPDEPEVTYGTWGLDLDASIRQSADQSFGFGICTSGIELISPVLRKTPSDFETVCRAVTAVGRYKTDLNKSMGLHVHVGNGKLGFDLATLRSLSAFLWTFETTLDTIHPTHRYKNSYCKNLWDGSILGKNCRQNGGTTRAAGLERILSCKSIKVLCKLLRHQKKYGKRLAYEFGLLTLPYQDDTKRTIEFRQAATTLDAEWILKWAEICIGIVQYASDTEVDTVAQLCRESIDKDISLESVLGEIGCSAPGVPRDTLESSGEVYCSDDREELDEPQTDDEEENEGLTVNWIPRLWEHVGSEEVDPTPEEGVVVAEADLIWDRVVVPSDDVVW